MEKSVLAAPFTRLSTSGSRLAALQALLDELMPHEWRCLKSLLNQRSFQCDLVGLLPVELVAHIFSYLDTSTPWRLQLVSRSWAEKLRSLVLLKTSLDGWYNGAVNLQGADQDFCRRKARSVHAFRHGSPSAMPDSVFTITHNRTHPGGRTQLLSGDSLIWMEDSNHRQLNVFNLRSWSIQKLNIPSRECIQSVYASEEIVVFTSYKTTAYVARLDGTGPMKTFRVPNAKLLRTLTCRERTVACAGFLGEGFLVYIWDFDTQEGRSFVVSYEDAVFSCNTPGLAERRQKTALLLQPRLKTIMLCTIDNSAMCRISSNESRRTDIIHVTGLRYSRFTYAGECLSSCKQVLDAPECNMNELDSAVRDYASRVCFIPTSHDGLFALQYEGWRLRLPTALAPLQFDENLQAFRTFPNHVIPLAINVAGSGVVWWKDTFFKAGLEEHLLFHKGTISEPRYTPLLSRVRKEETDGEENYDDERYEEFLLVNDRYIIRTRDDKFHICCFDHTIQLPDEEGRLGNWGSWSRIDPSLLKRVKFLW